jgi:preprotein translocase subunit SecG
LIHIVEYRFHIYKNEVLNRLKYKISNNIRRTSFVLHILLIILTLVVITLLTHEENQSIISIPDSFATVSDIEMLHLRDPN